MAILPSIPPYFASPRYDDKIVQTLQVLFQTNLPWLVSAYAIARVGVNANDNYTYPQIQANNATNTHYDIRPDASVASYCFFEVDRPYEIDFNESNARYFLSVTFWGSLPLIDPAKTHDFTGQLVQDVVKQLKLKDAADVKIEENPDKIFTKYSGLKQETNQYLMKRYTAFKISFSILDGFKDECVVDAPDVCQLNINRLEAMDTDLRTCILAHFA